MFQDSLTSNINPLPPDPASLFKSLIRSQDEVPVAFSKTYFVGNSLDKHPEKYIQQARFEKDKAYCTSVFYTGKKVSTEITLKEIEFKQSDTVFYILMFCVLVCTMIFFLKNKRIIQVFKAFYTPYFTNQLIRDGMIQKEFFAFPMLLSYFISLALIVSKCLNYFFDIRTSNSYFLGILAILIVLYVFKAFIVNFSKWIFKTQKETSEYNTNNFIFSIIIGFFLVPTTFMIYYVRGPVSTIILYLVLTIMVLLFLYRTIRSILIGIASERYNLYYFILYLCTIEFLPPIVIVKLLINYYLNGKLIA